MIKYPEKLVPGSQLFHGSLNKHSTQFELDSKPEKAMLNNNNNNFIFLMPESSRLKKMKQHRHVKRT
ncbi:uncharacterized protein METZ01_LOCUS103877 [marine metagenome]|uniref:Uncharacterized protein n=1 Tax=marine metagenome TaxID=408172 RepID=A0A381WGG6_9ZZZZ